MRNGNRNFPTVKSLLWWHTEIIFYHLLEGIIVPNLQIRMETIIKWGKCRKLHRFLASYFWINNKLLTLWLFFTTWLKNWQCPDSVTLIKSSLKFWRRKCPSLLKTPRPIINWLGSHQRDSIRLECRRWSSGRTFPKILFWTGKRMWVNMHNAFGSGGNQGKINILTMEWIFASLFLHSYRYVQWRECFQSGRRPTKSQVKIWSKICVKSACFCKWMEIWMICTIHL